VFYAGYIFLRLITLAILVYCVLSWFRPRFRAFDMLGAFIRPFVAPFQGLSMKVRQYFQAPVDFTFLFAIIFYQVLERVWWWLYALLARRL
jgi:uncharacterized protein YggT (Ycf19 family)